MGDCNYCRVPCWNVLSCILHAILPHTFKLGQISQLPVWKSAVKCNFFPFDAVRMYIRGIWTWSHKYAYYRCTKKFLPNDVDIWMHQNKHAHTPTGPCPYFDISATQAYSNKSNTDKLCETMQNQCYSPVKKKQRNLGVRFKPSALLEFALPLESCSDINARPTSCLIVILSLNVLFLQYVLF